MNVRYFFLHRRIQLHTFVFNAILRLEKFLDYHIGEKLSH